MQGGAIGKKVKRRQQKKEKKIEEALQQQMQGGRVQRIGKRTFHSATHKYLMEKLTGRGGKLDSSLCRKKMHDVMKNFHPSVFQTYITGKYHDPTIHDKYDMKSKPHPYRKERRPDVISFGGSLKALTHSVNGLLQSHDSTFYHSFEMI